MKNTKPDVSPTIYRCGDWQIRRDVYSWAVERLAVSGEKSRVPGEEVARDATYHMTLAQACRKCALNVAAGESRSLKEFALSLDHSCAKLEKRVKEVTHNAK